ncbi:MAG: DUF4359 domain-containing protein [Bacteroidetes bacterium]|nr:DUF4359 domain-containing protein [Bacteroidota bacterium]
MLRWIWSAAGLCLCAVLIATNPDQEAFSRFATAHLERWLTEQAWGSDHEQRRALAQGMSFLAVLGVKRQNLLLLSLYTVDLSRYTGRRADRWRFLGVLGRFVTLQRPPSALGPEIGAPRLEARG